MKPVHICVAIMIELRNCGDTEKMRSIHLLCKTRLRDLIQSYPNLREVISRYLSVDHPYNMDQDLLETKYNDTFRDEIQEIVSRLMQTDTPEEMVSVFENSV